ncbi:MAG TPA: hypothetical protein VIL30_12575 [Ramlibacter sp.]
MKHKLESSEDAVLARLARNGGRQGFARSYPRLHRVLVEQLRVESRQAIRASINRLNKGQPMRTRSEVQLASFLLRLSPLRLLWIWLNFHQHPLLSVYCRRSAKRSATWIFAQIRARVGRR